MRIAFVMCSRASRAASSRESAGRVNQSLRCSARQPGQVLVAEVGVGEDVLHVVVVVQRVDQLEQRPGVVAGDGSGSWAARPRRWIAVIQRRLQRLDHRREVSKAV